MAEISVQAEHMLQKYSLVHGDADHKKIAQTVHEINESDAWKNIIMNPIANNRDNGDNQNDIDVQLSGNANVNGNVNENVNVNLNENGSN